MFNYSASLYKSNLTYTTNCGLIYHLTQHKSLRNTMRVPSKLRLILFNKILQVTDGTDCPAKKGQEIMISQIQ